MKYTGHIVDVVRREVFDGEVEVNNGVITGITPRHDIPGNAPYWMPGFIDSHVHIESSMMLPSAFARTVVKSGTIGVISDPHEIANVLGVDGVDYLLQHLKCGHLIAVSVIYLAHIISSLPDFGCGHECTDKFGFGCIVAVICR